MQNYKNTLLMPKTDFPMKGNLGTKEVDIQASWKKLNLYKKKLQQNQDLPSFILHDGPPYANGNIHIGHALNKILKDFIVRFYNMQGFYAPYIPGWDTHGLPIEAAIQKQKGYQKTDKRLEFTEQCAAFALMNVEKQKEQFKRLGILGDWDHPYITLKKDFVADQIRIFGKMLDKGLIFKTLRPISWSPTLESALAEAELEYQDHQSPSIYISFPLTQKIDQFADVCLLVWTTTPWTVPANVAVALHPDKEYQIVKIANKLYLAGAKNLPELAKIFCWQDFKVIASYQGKQIENLEYTNPLSGKLANIVLADFVLDDEGTGLVHIAPGHGYDDFLLTHRYKHLKVLCSINKKGFMTSLCPKYEGMYYLKANEVIIQDLTKSGFLLKSGFITHSYPHDWRTKKPVLNLAVPQWFASVDKIKKELLNEIQKVDWVPHWGSLKMSNMIKDRKDWTISRQRRWGTPITIFYTENEQPILDVNLINYVADLIAKHGPEIWYEWEAKKLLPTDYTHPDSPNGIFTKEVDIMDVWFDSGTSYSILKDRFNVDVADVYLEGSDQYRGWFNSSLITSVAAFKKAPYKTVITHGFVFDGQGKKMSKSLGNVIDPLTIASQKGADIIRLWVANTNYSFDVRINNAILNQIEDIYRKIRNTFRFMLGNLHSFDKKKHYIDFESRNKIHQAVILDLEEVLKQVLNAYQTYNFEAILRHLFPFITNKISAFYFDFIKDILYIEKEEHLERKMIQSTIYDLLSTFLKILTPIIPHTTSEVYSFCHFFDQEDIYLESMPKLKNYQESKLLLEYYNFLSLRKAVLKSLEKARQNNIINSSLQAHINLSLTETQINILDILQIKNQLHQLFIVSKVTLTKHSSFAVEVIKAIGYPCQRCWNVAIEESNHDLCLRCKNILK